MIMVDSTNAIIERITNKHLRHVPESGTELSRKDKMRQQFQAFLRYLIFHKKAVFAFLLILTIALVVVFALLEDYLTKRQAYPIRHVLFQCSETVSFARNVKSNQDRFWERDSRTIIQQGNGDGTKLGDILGIHKFETTDEGGQYQLEDKDKTRIAYAVTKVEPVQAGLSFRGTLDFRETYAELLGGKERYIIYHFLPERGEKNIQVNVYQDKVGNKHLVNKLTTYRSVPLGVIWGTKFRAGTALDGFLDTPENQAKQTRLLDTVDRYQTSKDISSETRQALVEEMLNTIESMQTDSIYISYEDGVFDYIPQESSTYLFSRPELSARVFADLAKMDLDSPSDTKTDISKPFAINNKNNDVVHLRVERLVDLWPGNYALMNKLAIGESPNVVRPFAHSNNGGYEIRDDRGVIARIKIEDFILQYGDDLVYHYYLDKNGDGVIDEDSELIGKVLYRVNNDERSLVKLQDNDPSNDSDITQHFSYSFMAGSSWKSRKEDFYLCNTVESFIVNEINRGFGTFSDLGWINNQRSNIRLLENRNLGNLARAMSPESALVAKRDIVALLRAAKRSYVNKYIAQKPVEDL